MQEKRIFIDAKDQVMNIDDETRKVIKSVLKKCISLWKEKKFRELADYSAESIASVPDIPKGEGDSMISEIYFLLASALHELKQDTIEAKKLAVMSARFDRMNKNAFWLIREIDGLYSENSVYMKLQVRGDMYFYADGTIITQPFKTVYGVVAESPVEALQFIKDFERVEIRDSLQVIKSNTIEAKPELPKGVYDTMRLIADMDIEMNDENKEFEEN